MLYAIDTNVIFDILLADPVFGPASRDLLADLFDHDVSLVACDVVWAEASAGFPDKVAFRRQMSALGIGFSPLSETAAVCAGELWRNARNSMEKPLGRQVVVPDFLIGAHAQECADALITRDRGFMRTWFADLRIVDPSNPP